MHRLPHSLRRCVCAALPRARYTSATARSVLRRALSDKARPSAPPDPSPSPPRAFTSANRGVNSFDFVPVSWQSLALFAVTGAAILVWFQKEREKQRANRDYTSQVIGKPNLGGPFSLVDHDGRAVTEKSYAGKFMLLYFGFTHCPDICPDELEKMSKALDIVGQDKATPTSWIQPLFITVDPQRDTPSILKEYLSEFHPSMIGLTGPEEEIKRAAKAYRVYYSAPIVDTAAGETDYLVDHSIFFFLMDPEGQFVDYYGKNLSAVEVAQSIRRHIRDYKR